MKSSDSRLQQLRSLLAEWAEFQFTDTDRSNRAIEECNRIAGELRAEGCLVESFMPLLEHSDPAVALYAATFMITNDAPRATAVLEAISRQPGNVGLTAQMTLWAWRNGSLKLPS